MSRKYSYFTYTTVIREYCIEFESSDDAEYAYDRAVEWQGRQECGELYYADIGDTEIYIVCESGTLHKFLRYIEAEIDVEEGEL